MLEELERLHFIMRDHHVDEMAAIDLRLLEGLHALQSKLESSAPIHVLSGYRSPSTNAMLKRKYRNVAENSYHMRGRAVDFWLPGRRTGALRRAALSLRVGGVGYYPRSQFVHLDTGPRRVW